MSPSLSTLHRLREHARKESQQKLQRAERQRDEQQARLDELRRDTEEARSSVDPSDLMSMHAWHAWRLRQEVGERREVARLSQRERDLESARGQHNGRVRDELAIANAIDAEVERQLWEARRTETKELDEVGSRRRVA